MVTKLRIALAQVNATVGDLHGNAELIVEWTRRAAARGARAVVFPEMMLTGYPVEDLALRASFVEASIATLHDVAARLAAEGLGGIAVVTGYLDRRADLAARTGLPAGAPQDAAALLHGGQVVVTSAKHHLPNYGVFDEFRYFVPGDTLPVFRIPAGNGESVDAAIAICEDLWQEGGPVTVCRKSGAAVLLVPNASPYERGKDDVRLDLVARRAREAGAALAYANMVGGQDELVFDGDSILVAADGTLLARGPQFEEALIVADLDLPAAAGASGPGEERVDARDGTEITVKRVTLPDLPLPRPPSWSLSRGPRGRAGAVAAAVGSGRGLHRPGHRGARLRAQERVPVGDPGPVRRHRLGADGDDRRRRPRARRRARGAAAQPVLLGPLGLRRRGAGQAAGAARADGPDRPDGRGVHHRAGPGRVPGDRAAAGEPAGPGARRDPDGPVQRGRPPGPDDGQQERAGRGYSTLYGDSAGGFGPIKDVFKTTVWELSRWRNEEAARQGATPPIPENSITKPPSAELAPGQLDTDSLPPYEELDALLDDYVENDLGSAALIAAGHDPALVERVIRLVDTAEYKRRQYPPGPKISQKNFGRDRRLPITNRWREHLGQRS